MRTTEDKTSEFIQAISANWIDYSLLRNDVIPATHLRSTKTNHYQMAVGYKCNNCKNRWVKDNGQAIIHHKVE